MLAGIDVYIYLFLFVHIQIVCFFWVKCKVLHDFLWKFSCDRQLDLGRPATGNVVDNT